MHIISIPAFAVDRGRLTVRHRELDPKRTAAIAIDFQRFFIDEHQPMANRHAVDAVMNANRINEAVRATGGIVILCQHSNDSMQRKANGELVSKLSEDAPKPLVPGAVAFELHPKLEQSEHDLRIVKNRSSALHPEAATGLMEILRSREIDSLIISGLVTNGCCESTARDASQYGLDVVFASDATAAMSDQEHNASLLNLSLYYARVVSTDDIVAALRHI